MSKSVPVLLLAGFLALPAFAQVVRVTQTDGKVVQGELLGYGDGRYQVRLSGGTVQEIDEARVKDIVLISPTGEGRAPRDSGALDAARAALERNDLDLAFERASEAMRSLEDNRTQAAELTARISAAYLDRLLEQKDSARLAEGLRTLLPSLPPGSKRELFQKMADRLADLHRTAPDSAFTFALSDALARLADSGALSDESRAALADLFVERAQKAWEKGDSATALTLLRGAVRTDPRKRDALKGRLFEVALARAKALLEKGDPTGAAAAARDAAEADPNSSEAKHLLAAVEIAAFRSRIDAEAASPELAQSLREFLKRDLVPGDRAWAEQALARTTGPSRPEAAQLAQYYPVKAGRFMLYRRSDGEFTERLRTDSLVREGEVLKVYNTVKETYRDYGSTKAYLVEIERDTVYLPTTTTEREPLLRFPCQAGDSWTWQVQQREFKRSVRSLGESVTVGREGASRVYPNCLVVDFTSTLDRDGTPVSVTSRSSYAPGLGLVKMEFLSPEYEKFNLELVDSGQE